MVPSVAHGARDWDRAVSGVISGYLYCAFGYILAAIAMPTTNTIPPAMRPIMNGLSYQRPIDVNPGS